MMRIALGSDHGGYALKCKIKEHLESRGYECVDFGCHSLESCDYPDFGEAAARAVAAGDCPRGIVICTTGIGISMAANKEHPLLRGGAPCPPGGQGQRHPALISPAGGPA